MQAGASRGARTSAVHHASVPAKPVVDNHHSESQRPATAGVQLHQRLPEPTCSWLYFEQAVVPLTLLCMR